MSPLASIIILTKDQRRFLKRSLPAIFSQTIKNLEVILIDSSAKEDNKDLFAKYPVRRVVIHPDDFQYASAFNKGASLAKGKFLVRLSGDAIPKDKSWLKSLLNNFKNKKVGGVYSRWVNNTKANLFDRFITFVAMPNERVVFSKAPNWSGASGALRKELWQKYPFNEKLDYCEDWDWSRTIQKNGYLIVYEPKSVVYHSNNENILRIGLRGFKTIRALIKIYSQKNVSNF